MVNENLENTTVMTAEEISGLSEFQEDRIAGTLEGLQSSNRISHIGHNEALKTERIPGFFMEYFVGTSHDDEIVSDMFHRGPAGCFGEREVTEFGDGFFAASDAYAEVVLEHLLKKEGIELGAAGRARESSSTAYYFIRGVMAENACKYEWNSLDAMDRVADAIVSEERDFQEGDCLAIAVQNAADDPKYGTPEDRRDNDAYSAYRKQFADSIRACRRAGLDFKEVKKTYEDNEARGDAELAARKASGEGETFGDYKARLISDGIELARFEVPIVKELLDMGYTHRELCR